MKRITIILLRTVVACLVLGAHVSTIFAQCLPYSLLTITNPSATEHDNFGNSVAAMGTDRVLVGAWQGDADATDAGVAYLFSITGQLLTTFTNPTPTESDYFGSTVAAAGIDSVLVAAGRGDAGATNAGTVYLFSTNGALLTTFTNPTPATGDVFGTSMAALGSDRVLIGAPFDDRGAEDVGVAYLFNTNGALLTTFTNPTPASYDEFGWSVAAVGSNLVLIAARLDDAGAVGAGAAYLFNSNGALLTTFTNPTPAFSDEFGFSVAAMGSDRVLIGSPFKNVGALAAGVVHLFSTNGVLLTTFTNPAPADYDLFGYCVIGARNEQVLVGAPYKDTGAADTGAAYLFSTTGSLLTTFTNPTPAPEDMFGMTLASLGSDLMLIGANLDDTSASDAGAVYLFSIPSNLTIRLTTTNTIAVSWPSPSVGWTLQENTNDLSAINWSNAPGPIQDDGMNKTLIVNPPVGNRFYRLFKL